MLPQASTRYCDYKYNEINHENRQNHKKVSASVRLIPRREEVETAI